MQTRSKKQIGQVQDKERLPPPIKVVTIDLVSEVKSSPDKKLVTRSMKTLVDKFLEIAPENRKEEQKSIIKNT